ncbi:transcription antitermination protein BlgG [Companilactobacillus sp. RD055328]|uniref:PRD domain-containing protein n=1 Tax=Companilactobacillus sp. RD055328 TaxID=2916634 RepID=UPI001FC8D845|nr:PRD domain-containing protein [Companilactobacillus sp. RD055328]GKQ42189.1 transcription antitermination protein BlgG [Companilactobacillus sp. RD055328]
MKFIKNFNNNAALVRDDKNSEFVVVGKGVGFGKKIGQEIDENKVEHRYKAADDTNSELKTLIEISSEVLQTVDEIIKHAEEVLKITFDDYQYLTLADHVDFAVKRAQQKVEVIEGAINWSISNMYPKEYQVALDSLEVVEKNLVIKLDKGEAIFFTYHFLNAASENEEMQDTIYIAELINHIVEITQYQYGELIDNKSFNYSRFIAHLRMFILHHLNSEEVAADELDPSFTSLMRMKYPNAYETVGIITDFLEKTEHWQLTSDEKVYLSLHIFRVTHKK